MQKQAGSQLWPLTTGTRQNVRTITQKESRLSANIALPCLVIWVNLNYTTQLAAMHLHVYDIQSYVVARLSDEVGSIQVVTTVYY